MENHPDPKGDKLGMWLFLYTEIMLFTGLFILYAAYFKKYPADFAEGGKDLQLIFGAANTVLLLISSCAVAASITAVRRSNKNLTVGLLCTAWLLGGIFLFNKYLEWSHKIRHGIYPNSPDMAAAPPGRSLFFDLYYIITGLHGLHLLVGMILLSVCAVMVQMEKVNAQKYILLENAGLYWHLIDLIWIFIFPLFYLIV
ncbi:MAG: cytochrome c oxidase subunit 3 family protein [Desulfosalsimonadaceae bacterium]